MASLEQRQIAKTLNDFYNKPVAKVSAELVFSIVAVIFFALFAIRPTLITMSDLIREIDEKKVLNDKLGQKVAALNSIQNEYLALQDRMPLLDEAIPSTPQFVTAIKLIEKVASEQKLVIQNIQANEVPQEPAAAQDVSFSAKTRLVKPISISVTGDYTSIKNFIEELRKLRRTTIIDSIIFSLTDESASKKLRATITINLVYFGKENTVKPAANTAENLPGGKL
jgi:Tfp pilus assembly protein PilO